MRTGCFSLVRSARFVVVMVCCGACDSTPVEPPPAGSTPVGTTAVAPSASASQSNVKPRAVFGLTFNGALPRDVLVLEGVPRKLARVVTASAQNPRRWREIVVTTSAGERRVVEFRERFSEGHEVALHLDAKQRVRLGVFKLGSDLPVEQIEDVRSIDLLYDEPTKGPLTVRFGNDVKTLDPALLNKLPPVPKGADGDMRGVRLRDVLRALSPQATIGSVTVTARDNRTICAAELNDPSRDVLLRTNQRGQLSVEWWLATDTSRPSTRLRDLEELVVAREPCPQPAP